MTRDKHQRDQDRADLLAVLEEADGGPLRTDTLIARANGMHDPALTDTSWWRHYSRGMADLRALERQGRILGLRDPLSRWARWKLATDLDADAASDHEELARMAARWEPDEQANPPRPQVVPDLVPTSSQRPPRTPAKRPRPRRPLSFGGDEVAESSRDDLNHLVPSTSPDRDDLPHNHTTGAPR